jgi:hypothetical protein
MTPKLAVVAAVGVSYLGDARAVAHDVAFYHAAAAAGTLLGLAAAFARIRPDQAGRITARADVAFLAVWLVAIGAGCCSLGGHTDLIRHDRGPVLAGAAHHRSQAGGRRS